MQSIKERRSIRKYKDSPLSKSFLNELFELASRASTTGNMQLYSVVVTTQKEVKEQLAPAHFNQPMVMNAPVVLTFCADFNRFSEWCKLRNAKPGYNNLLSFSTAAIDALLFAQNFCTIAEENGLGICYLGTVTYNPQMIIDVLDLPKLVFPIAAITVGYPDEDPSQTDRLPIEAIVHDEKYKDYTAERIDSMYALKESLEENKKFIEINNKETLAQIFTDIRYRESDNISMSENMIKVLKQQGFL